MLKKYSINVKDMNELISKDDFVKALKLNKLRLDLLAPALMKVLKLDKVNELYDTTSDERGAQFADHILSLLGVEYEVSESDLKHIPTTEPFILIANHPYGGIDGLILISILGKLRPDAKLMANFLLRQIEPLKEHIIAVNPFENVGDNAMNLSGTKELLTHLKTSPIGVFPAGEVSALKLKNFKIEDKKWSPNVGKIVAKSGVKVVPVYFSGHNSLAFNLLGLINPNIRTIKLPSELFNKHEKIKVRIGKPINPKTIIDFANNDELMRYLRAMTYALGANQVRKNIKLSSTLKGLLKPKDIIEETNKSILSDEISLLGNDLLYSYENFKVYMSDATHIPSILREISRLREITFREVGEGTNRSYDSDEFDFYYKHLFVWDEKEQRIAGAYRIGLGDELFNALGKRGFYLYQLFKIKKGFYPILQQSIEMGRSFVVKDYQRRPLSLMLLWKGINEFLKRNKGIYKYMIGPVSISNQFSRLSKELLVSYIRLHHYDRNWASLITPRKKFKYKYDDDEKALLKAHADDIKQLDNLIGEIENNQLKIPVLVKKYLKLNAKIVAFNIDPKFNDALDGFLIVNVDEIPDEAFDMVSRN
jgi:putative hemolysin